MKAHRFYELLYKKVSIGDVNAFFRLLIEIFINETLKPEELVNHLIEHEAEFQLSDYVNLLNLIYRSKPGDEIHSLADNIASLENILKNKDKQH
jgi:hypothetical protein